MKEYNVTARYYDLIYTGEQLDDEDFWPEIAKKSKGAILELGCGTGRVTFALASLGFEITGLDNSEAMLNKARTRLANQPPDVKGRVMLCKGDMADFTFDTKFGLVIIPFRGFQHILDPERQTASLQCVREHLTDDGLLVVDLFNPDLKLLVHSGQADRIFEMEQVEPETGNTVVRYVRNRHDYIRQVIQGKFVYERFDQDGKLVSTEIENYSLRWTWRWEMEYLLRLAGFKIEALYGNYHRIPYPRATSDLIFVCSLDKSKVRRPTGEFRIMDPEGPPV